eukprot:764574-Hanusia_phi.AAC.1
MDGQDRELTLAEMYNAIGIYNLWIQHQMQRQAISLTSNSSNSNSNSNSNNNSNSNSSNNSRSNLSYNSMAGGNVNLSSLQTIGNFSALLACGQVGGTSSAMGLMSNDLEVPFAICRVSSSSCRPDDRLRQSLKKLSSLQASLHTSQPAVNTQIDMLQQANAVRCASCLPLVDGDSDVQQAEIRAGQQPALRFDSDWCINSPCSLVR